MINHNDLLVITAMFALLVSSWTYLSSRTEKHQRCRRDRPVRVLTNSFAEVQVTLALTSLRTHA
jgi:hypothetical protein